MSKKTTDSPDEILDDDYYVDGEDLSYEDAEPTSSGRHLKGGASGTHTRRRASGERAAYAASSEGEASPHRQRRAGEEAPRRERTRRPEEPRRKKRRKKKKSRTGLTVLITVLVVLVVLALAGYLLFMHFYGMLNTGSKSTPTATPSATAVVQTSETQPELTPEPTPEPTPTPAPLTEEEKAALAEMELKASLQEDAEEIMYNENVYNVLLIGADGLEDTMDRSDAMILASVNKETGEIWLTSLMRDTQVTIPNWGLAHLNWATSIGGIDMLIDTIESESNFAIQVDNWAMVNFLDFVKVANLLGPVTVSVKASEAENMNQNIRQVCQMIDASEGRGVNDWNNIPRYYFPEGEDGTYTITDGAQILGYCRERKVGGDTGRSEKQREVLMQMFENVRNMTLAQQYELVKTILPIVSTDMTAGQCFSLLLQLPSMAGYEIHTQQCPVPGAFWKGRDGDGLSIYNADFRVNRNVLRATIYGERLSAAELTSSWTGVSQLVYWNEAWN